jgi:hypothetical protein
MGSNKITGLGTPTAGTDAATKDYVDTQRDTRLPLAGGTMTGNIVMGSNKVTSTATPTADDDLTRKGYVDSILGSATSAATSAAAAATSATNAANSATSAASSATAAAASYDSFDDRYLGSKTSNPTLDNDGAALLTGALYFNSTAGEMRVYNGTAWVAAYLPAAGYMDLTTNQTAAGVKTFSSNPILSGGTANGVAYLNGSKVLTTGSALTFDGTTFTASGSSNPEIKVKSTAGTTGNYAGILFDSWNSFSGSGQAYVRGVSSASGNSNTDLSFGVNASGFGAPSEAMRLTSTGLGIGTSSPGSKLDVVGSGRFRGFDSGFYNENVIAIGSASLDPKIGMSSNTGFRWNMRINDVGGSGVGTFVIRYEEGSLDALTITRSGNVGIGTSSPQGQLSLGSAASGLRGLTLDWTGAGGPYPVASFTADRTTGEVRNFAFTNFFQTWYTNNSERMRLDSSGNLGLGVTPSAWRSTTRAIQVGTGASLQNFDNTGTLATTLASNVFFNSSDQGIYLSSRPATTYSQFAGQHVWNTAASGTAGNAISFTQAMTLTSGGNLLVGTTTDPGGSGKVVDSNGNVRAIPQSGSAKTTSYTLATGDVGEYIQVGSGGSITIPDATFASGDVVSVFNNTSGTITITCSITTAYIAGTDSDKATMTLASRGVATILFISGTVCVVSGNVT